MAIIFVCLPVAVRAKNSAVPCHLHLPMILLNLESLIQILCISLFKI